MATGNLLLGLGRRSIGDITLYRTRGQQRARARVRDVKNPRTIKQLATRAILSNVAQLYSLGRSIFDHSFEGYPVGQDNQLRFQKVNIARLRALLDADLNDADITNKRARIGVRNIKAASPFQGMQLSEGSLVQDVFSFVADPTDENTSFKMMAFDTETTVADFARRRGIKNNDIFTFVTLAINYFITIVDYTDPSTAGLENYFQLYQPEFYYVQLKAKANIEEDETPITIDSLWTDIFEIYGANLSVEDKLTTRALDDLHVYWSDMISGENKQSAIDSYAGVWGCIRSRYNTDLRSTSYAELQSYQYGMTDASLERAWGDSSGLQTAPDLILPGENF